jgi:signal peptidase II
MSRGPSKWVLLAVLVVAGLAADQGSKYLAVTRLTRVFDRAEDLTTFDRVRGFYGLHHLEPLATAPHTVWEPMWRMNYVENPGAAWGLGAGLSRQVRNVLFVVVSVVAAGAILAYYRRVRPEQRYVQVALALVLAGAMGNFVDRLARRYVIDFIEWYWWRQPDLRWPTFNVADALIVVGVTMLVLHRTPRESALGAPAN